MQIYILKIRLSSKNIFRAVKESVCKGECGKHLEDLRQKVRNLTSAAQLAADSHSQQVASLRKVRLHPKVRTVVTRI